MLELYSSRIWMKFSISSFCTWWPMRMAAMRLTFLHAFTPSLSDSMHKKTLHDNTANRLIHSVVLWQFCGALHATWLFAVEYSIMADGSFMVFLMNLEFTLCCGEVGNVHVLFECETSSNGMRQKFHLWDYFLQHTVTACLQNVSFLLWHSYCPFQITVWQYSA